jgi:hypothetical protein
MTFQIVQLRTDLQNNKYPTLSRSPFFSRIVEQNGAYFISVWLVFQMEKRPIKQADEMDGLFDLHMISLKN